VAEQAGSIDISRNTLSNDAVQGTPLIEMSVDDFSQPVAKAMRAQFLTARAVARRMVQRESGVILTNTDGYPEAFPDIGSTVVAWARSKRYAGSGRAGSLRRRASGRNPRLIGMSDVRAINSRLPWRSTAPTSCAPKSTSQKRPSCQRGTPRAWLIDTRTTPGGLVIHTYQAAGPPRYATFQPGG